MIVPLNSFPFKIFSRFSMSLPAAQITRIPAFCALTLATGSKGVFLPGIHSLPVILIKSSHEMESIGFAPGFVFGSSVYTLAMFERLTTRRPENFSAKRTASLSVEKPGFHPASI